MKKKTAVLAAFACLILAGCGNGASGGWKANENSIYVTKELSVESAMVYTSEKTNELYTQDGLLAYVQEAVASYNKEQGAAEAFENEKGGQKLPVALKECRLEGQTGTLVFEYDSAEDFVDFAEATGDNTHSVTALYTGSAQDLSGEFPDVNALTAEGKDAGFALVGSDGGLEEGALSKLKNCKAVITEGAATVYVDGRIAYVTPGVTVKAENAAIMPKERSCIFFK